MIRVEIPISLRELAKADNEICLNVKETPTIGSLLDELEAQYPILRGNIRDRQTLIRRPFLRYYACGEDLSNETMESSLPDEVILGQEVFIILGSVAGG